LILTSPSGHTYVTTPGSALLFPSLCAPTGDLPPPQPREDKTPCADRSAMMPLRASTRAQNRARYITTERHHNQQARQARPEPWQPNNFGPPTVNPSDDDEPPPF
jgi:hypothetical protein